MIKIYYMYAINNHFCCDKNLCFLGLDLYQIHLSVSIWIILTDMNVDRYLCIIILSTLVLTLKYTFVCFRTFTCLSCDCRQTIHGRPLRENISYP